jgi:hypothetical protein
MAENFGRTIASFLILGIFARELSDREFANLTLWLTSVGLGAQVVVMGTSTLFFSRILKNVKIISSFIRKIIFIRIMILCTIFILILLVSIFSDNQDLFLASLFATLSIEATNIFKEQALIQGRSVKIFLSGMGQLLTTIFCIILLYHYQSYTLSYAILIIVTSRFVGASLYYEFIAAFVKNASKTLQYKLNFHTHLVILTRSARLMTSMLLCSFSFSLPLYYLSFMEFHQDASFYGASMRLILLMFIIPSIFSNVLFIYYSNYFKLGLSYAVFLMSIILMLYLLVITPFLIIFGDILFGIIYGHQYVQAADSFVSLSAIFLFYSLRAGYSKVLIKHSIDIVLIKQSILIFFITLSMIALSYYFVSVSLAFYSTLVGELIGLVYVFCHRRSRKTILYDV